MRIIGYTFEADCHCVSCTQKRKFKLDAAREGFRQAKEKDEHGVPVNAMDNEGNPIHPMFSTDEQLEPQYCGDCRERIE